MVTRLCLGEKLLAILKRIALLIATLFTSLGACAAECVRRAEFDHIDPLGMPPERISTLVVSSDGHQQRSLSIIPRQQSLQQSLLDATASSESLTMVHGKRVGYLHLWLGTLLGSKHRRCVPRGSRLPVVRRSLFLVRGRVRPG